MKKFIAFLLILSLVSCRKQIDKHTDYRFIPEDKIPSNSVLTLDGYEYLIDGKIIGKQWHDFKDGTTPGVYYISIP